VYLQSWSSVSIVSIEHLDDEAESDLGRVEDVEISHEALLIGLLNSDAGVAVDGGAMYVIDLLSNLFAFSIFIYSFHSNPTRKQLGCLENSSLSFKSLLF
jgi:hypothetical protein